MILTAVSQFEDGAGRYVFNTNTSLQQQISIFRLNCLDYVLNRVQACFRAKKPLPAYDGYDTEGMI